MKFSENFTKESSQEDILFFINYAIISIRRTINKSGGKKNMVIVRSILVDLIDIEMEAKINTMSEKDYKLLNILRTILPNNMIIFNKRKFSKKILKAYKSQNNASRIYEPEA